ncbi:MAG TPA: hypothetical protein VJ914_16580 [Pseudonocardiaceae bacterium]|nr:hypothetical protein [Pseudonocardiaceae bacterium]
MHALIYLSLILPVAAAWLGPIRPRHRTYYHHSSNKSAKGSRWR